MKIVNTILAELIRQGKVTVDIPGLDMDELKKLANGEAQRVLRKIAETVACDELTDAEKFTMIRDHL